MSRITRQALALIGVVAVTLTAGAPLTPRAHAAMMMGRLTLLAPTAGTVVTGNTLPVQIAVKDVTLTCAWAGKAPRDGQGHWHLLLDGRRARKSRPRPQGSVQRLLGLRSSLLCSA
jgi:hypothetical protein